MFVPSKQGQVRCSLPWLFSLTTKTVLVASLTQEIFYVTRCLSGDATRKPLDLPAQLLSKRVEESDDSKIFTKVDVA